VAWETRPTLTPRLAPLPDRFAETVATLHRLAEEVVAPARKPDNEIALEATPGGFGTPRFEWEGATRRVRVEAAELVRETDGAEERTPLDVDVAAAAALAGWFEFGTSVLRRLAAEAAPGEASPPPILWPEHFDVAIELGCESDGRRATYGFSPGDEQHPEPYAYVGPWAPRPAGGVWDARGFAGAELPYAELLAAADPEATALEFFVARREALANDPTEEAT
jgi:hypothetical protein